MGWRGLVGWSKRVRLSRSSPTTPSQCIQRAGLPQVAFPSRPSLERSVPTACSPSTRSSGRRRTANEPSLVSPKVTPSSVARNSQRWSIQRRPSSAPNSSLRDSRSTTRSPGPTHSRGTVTRPPSTTGAPASRIAHWGSCQKSSPATSPCATHRDWWCGWSRASRGPGSMGKPRVMGAPVGPRTGCRKGIRPSRWRVVKGAPSTATRRAWISPSSVTGSMETAGACGVGSCVADPWAVSSCAERQGAGASASRAGCRLGAAGSVEGAGPAAGGAP